MSQPHVTMRHIKSTSMSNASMSLAELTVCANLIVENAMEIYVPLYRIHLPTFTLCASHPLHLHAPCTSTPSHHALRIPQKPLTISQLLTHATHRTERRCSQICSTISVVLPIRWTRTAGSLKKKMAFWVETPAALVSKSVTISCRCMQLSHELN